MTVAELLVRCLEEEGVEWIFGLPGEENVDLMDVLLDSRIAFVTVRHEQGAAFMADVYGRITGRAGVCLTTLGPGATNLVTGVADANMDGAPLVAIAGQASTTRMHKESHQHLDLLDLFSSITKYAGQVRSPQVLPEVVRKAFKVAQTEKPGATFIDLPENVAAADAGDAVPLTAQQPAQPAPNPEKAARAAELIDDARRPVVLAGNGVIRAGASDALLAFAERLQVPVATTFMAKGAVPGSHPLSIGAAGYGLNDHPVHELEAADLVVCVGYDIVEYPPERWNADGTRRIVHVAEAPAEVDAHYVLAVGVIAGIGDSLHAIAAAATPRPPHPGTAARRALDAELAEHAASPAFPMPPQRIVSDLRTVLAPDDVVVCDVGAHKVWMARLYRAEAPNTCIISNGLAAMGIGVPGAVAAKLALPERKVVAVTGDAGFLMNSQEIETALRVNAPIVILIWNDGEYGLITWHQMRRFGRPSHVAFANPDFVAYAESFGAAGYRVESPDELVPILRRALADDTVSVIDCPVDYAENMRLTARLAGVALDQDGEAPLAALAEPPPPPDDEPEPAEEDPALPRG
jgi:acetolactate synthase-1/2/3 large subunit